MSARMLTVRDVYTTSEHTWLLWRIHDTQVNKIQCSQSGKKSAIYSWFIVSLHLHPVFHWQDCIVSIKSLLTMLFLFQIAQVHCRNWQVKDWLCVGRCNIRRTILNTVMQSTVNDTIKENIFLSFFTLFRYKILYYASFNIYPSKIS